MEDLKRKRAMALANAAVRLMEKGAIDKSKYVLNAILLDKAVGHYLLNLEFLKKRYGIQDKAKMPKIAGLMAYSITKFKPLVPMHGVKLDTKYLDANEWLAIYYGLCACADMGNGNADEEALGLVVSNPFFEDWFKSFKYLLGERNYTAESLVMVFETLGFVFRNSYAAEA
jgi:hypothetical protein